MFTNKINNRMLLVFIVLFLVGCGASNVKNPIHDSNLVISDEWRISASHFVGEDSGDDGLFNFGSAQLEYLLNEASINSPSLKIAYERIVQAELQSQVAGSSLFPVVTLRGQKGARSNEFSLNSDTAHSNSLSLGVGYELDVWGKLSAGIDSANAELTISRLDADAIRITYLSGVAKAYFHILSAKSRLELAKQYLSLTERLLNIVESRYRHGSATSLDVSRQRITVLNQQASIKPIELQIKQGISALAVLLGRAPNDLELVFEDFSDMVLPEITLGIPSDLLFRRPDIASAEQRLVLANANIVRARAEMLPSFDLSGSLSVSSVGLVSFSNPTRSLNLAASLLHTIFDGKKRKAQHEITQSRKVQLVEEYRKVIIESLLEVEESLYSVERSKHAYHSQGFVKNESLNALRIAELRYIEGVADLQSLIESQRNLINSDEQIISARLSLITAYIDLYKALGGNWHNRS